ncbi:MAG: peptide chain release factor 1 [Chloroflexi bacterium]|jgi:peptide chain release factor 1|nr:MAG: peptide chain release factor 1 [Chloroflexota bacterium]
MLEKIETIKTRIDELESMLSDPDLVSDYSKSQGLIREHAMIKPLAELSKEFTSVVEQIEQLKSIIRHDSDREVVELANLELPELQNKKLSLEQELRIALLTKDPNDFKNVIMEIRAGIGGEEASLFAADLYRMYSRYAQRRGWPLDILSTSQSDAGGIKEVVIQIKGDGAFSILKHESGGHRVQRVPMTESSGRIHTSAATVAVLPEAEEVDVNIKNEDIEIDVFHASGHGGQSVQKVATAIRIKHVPTGILAICQDERSQHKNKEKAMAVLRSRVYKNELDRQQKEISDNRRSQVGSGDRSERVRTYNFPQQRVTDHRTNISQYNLEEVLDGELDVFINGLIDREQQIKLEESGI